MSLVEFNQAEYFDEYMKKRILMALLCLCPLLVVAQNYEQHCDELFNQAQYEKAVKKYKMTKWKDEVGMTGKIYVVRVTVDGEFYRITSESMPEDGMKAFDEIASILVAAWKDGITKW